MLSIVIPTNKEFFASANLICDEKVEMVFVGLSEAATRAERINLGVQRCKGEMILLHHPRSRLDTQAIENLKKRTNEKLWGGFTHRFDVSHPLLKFTSFYSNYVRARIFSIVYLDHCIFFHRSFWQPLPAIAIFEDTVLSGQLKSFGRAQIWPYTSVTSAVRFIENGIWRQALLNQILKIGYYLNVSHERLNAVYEKGLDLNAKK